jgi:hypothetical protein
VQAIKAKDNKAAIKRIERRINKRFSMYGY